MNPADTLLGEIELIRKREGLSQTDVARRIHLTQSAWAAIRHGRRDMPLTAAELAKQAWPVLTTPVLRYYEYRAQVKVAAASSTEKEYDTR